MLQRTDYDGKAMTEPRKRNERDAARPGPASISIELRMDLRALAAPEPMHRILDALQNLQCNQYLVALTPVPPIHLLPVLDQWGLAYRIVELSCGSGSITIWNLGGATEQPADAK